MFGNKFVLRTGEIAILVLSALLIVSAVVAFMFMPDTIAVHWGTDGVGYSSRFTVIWFSVSFCALVLLLVFAAGRYLEKLFSDDGSVYCCMLLLGFMMLIAGYLAVLMMFCASL